MSRDGLFAKLRVLIVDDSVEMRNLLVALLQSMGFTDIFCAASGKEGLRVFCDRNPDLIITDGSMRPMDGYEMTRRVRAGDCPVGDGNCGDRDVPVLMISGHADEDIVKLARDNGVTDYIVKPVTAETLYESILSAVSKPIHIVETGNYRGPSPKRRLLPRISDETSASDLVEEARQ
jgi:two-component system, chemotaxis family, chemotaxis protein CheY